MFLPVRNLLSFLSAMVVSSERDALKKVTRANMASAAGPLALTSAPLPRDAAAPMVLGHAPTRTLRLGRQALAKAESSDKVVRRQLPQPTVHVYQETPRRRPPQAQVALGMASVPTRICI